MTIENYMFSRYEAMGTSSGKVPKPDIFKYDNYRVFLKNHIKYLRRFEKLSPRSISIKAGLAESYLRRVISGVRNLSPNALEKVSPHLHLSQNELDFLKRLMQFQDASSLITNESAFLKIKRLSSFKDKNLSSIEAYDYLTEWYYPIIRTMVDLKDFKLDPQWIRKKLKHKVSESNIRHCLNFLIKNGYIELTKDNQARLNDVSINCTSGVQRVAMAKYHSKMYELATASIYETSREDRNIIGHTAALSQKDKVRLLKMCDDFIKSVENVTKKTKREKNEEVYQFHLSMFPLTK